MVELDGQTPAGRPTRPLRSGLTIKQGHSNGLLWKVAGNTRVRLAYPVPSPAMREQCNAGRFR